MPGLDETENTFRWRLQDPDLFDPDSFRTKNISTGISLVLGKKKGKTTMEAQSLMFDKSKFNKEQARQWIKDHKDKFTEIEEVMKYDLSDTFDISDVEIFATGEWNGDKYNDEDLEDIVRAFEETKPTLKPYLKLGHDDEQLLAQRDGMPAVGWIERLRKIGGKLIADFANVPKKVYELIKTGAYRRVSSEIFFNIKIGEKTFPRALKAVSLLGADTPAVSNLNDIISMYAAKVYIADKDCVTKHYEFNKIEGGTNMNELEKLQTEKDELAKQFEEVKAENEDLKKEGEEKDKKIEEGDKKVEEAKKEGEEAKEEIKKNKIEARRKEISGEVDKMIADPKTFAMPVDKDILCKLIEHHETAEVKTYKFGDEEKTVTAMFTELLSRERVTLNTEGKSQIGETGGNEDNSALHSQALKFAKENNVSYTDALISVSK